MTDQDTQSSLSDGGMQQDDGQNPQNAAAENTLFWQQKYAEARVDAAILKEGGNIELLKPHVMGAIHLDHDGDQLSVQCREGDRTMDLSGFVKSLRQREGYEQAFSSPQSAPVNRGGSGAQPAVAAPHENIKSEDPLAVGHALEAIARGHRTIAQ